MSENYTRQHTFANGIVADGDEVEDEFVAIEAGFAAMEADIAALGLGTLVPTPTAGDAYELVTVNAAGTAFILRPLADIKTWLGLNALAYLNTVAAAQIDSNAVTTAKILDANVTYAKIQNVSATDKILGRSTAGAGVVEEITCTAAARTLLDDTTTGAMLTTLGAAIAGAITAANLTMGTGKVLGRNTASTGAPEELTPGGGVAIASGEIYVGGDYARPPVRQTVLFSAVDSNGLPNFITDPNNGLEVAIAATSIPVVLTASNGAAARGARDRIGAISADTTISGLTDSTTNYLYADIASDGTVTLGKTTLAPVYQRGGSYSTTNGQFTFNIQEMVGKVGNGTTADQTYRVFIGEAVTSGGQVTSVVNYALNGRYQSADVSMTAAGATLYSFSHNIGVRDVKAAPLLRCTTGEYGYSAGDNVEPQTYITLDDSAPSTVRRSSRNACEIRSGAVGTNGFAISNATTSALTEPTAANWSIFMQAERGW